MMTEPHLIFAEASIDISRREFRNALDKLVHAAGRLPDSYLLNLLLGRANLGLGRYDEALTHLKRCCRIAPTNQVAWQELVEVTTLRMQEPPAVQAPTPAQPEEPAADPVAEEFEQLSIALSGFRIPQACESSDPTPIAEQRRPFPDDAAIAVPTESLANLFIAQGAYKKAIRVYTALIQLQPVKADEYRESIDRLLEKL